MYVNHVGRIEKVRYFKFKLGELLFLYVWVSRENSNFFSFSLKIVWFIVEFLPIFKYILRIKNYNVSVWVKFQFIVLFTKSITPIWKKTIQITCIIIHYI